ncbi:MAG TPA: hypothetical protein VF755_29135 [Catenuloplanes sp.]
MTVINRYAVGSGEPTRPQPLATFVKAGRNGEPIERLAYTPSDVVALTFDGWQRKQPTPLNDDPVTPPDAPGPRPDDGDPGPRPDEHVPAPAGAEAPAGSDPRAPAKSARKQSIDTARSGPTREERTT